MEKNTSNEINMNFRQENTIDPVIIKQEPTSSTDLDIHDEPYRFIVVKKEVETSESDISTDDEQEIEQPNSSNIQDTKRRVMGSQARELIAMVYQFMKKEAKDGVENPTDARWRTSQAAGVSQRTVTKILKEKRQADAIGQPIRSPLRIKKRKTIRRNMDEKDKEIVRETIRNFHRDFNTHPSLNGLKKVLADRINFTGCIETLRGVLKEVGFEFQHTKNYSSRFKVLVENP